MNEIIDKISKRKRVIGLVFLICILISFDLKFHLLNQFLMECSAPVLKVMVGSWRYLREIKENYLDLTEAKKENLYLKQKLATLNKKEVFYDELLSANKRLHKLLELKKRGLYPSLGGNVIGYAPHFNPRFIFLDRGSKDGLKLHFPVINTQGVVGQIASLSPHYAKVITILESNMAVGVISQRTRVQGIFVGSGVNMGKIKYIMKDEDIKVGDLFITSGVDGIFPKGICVGKVTSVFNHKMDIFKEITLKTSVDFSRLEEVLILLKSTDWSLFNEQG